MDLDDILEELGEFGKFQITTYILVCIPVFFGAANSLSYVFTAGTPDYRCFIPECEESGHTDYRTPWTAWAIPAPETHKSQILDAKLHLCDRFSINTTIYERFNETCTPDIFTKEITECSEWVFDGAEHTIVNEWNLTCTSNQWKVSLVGSSHFAGIIVGSALFGLLADWYGRKKVFIFCILLMSVSGMAQVVAPGYITFILMMFINAMGTAGIYPLAFIIGVEMVGKRKREITGIALNYFYAVGEAIVAPIAWLTRDWIMTQLIVSAPALLFIVYYWIIPESVRWLMANKRLEKASGIVQRVAKINKVQLTDDIMDAFKETCPLTTDTKGKDIRIKAITLRILTSKKLLLRLAAIYFIWAANAFIFYGLTVNSTVISGNKYVNFALISLIEIPGYTLAWVGIGRLGRKWSLVGALLICAVTCTLTIFVPNHMTWGVVTLFLLGKLGVTASFGIVYVYTAEMLPTLIRSGGVGVASTVARMGALLAPFVPLLGIYGSAVPMVTFGCVAGIAGCLAIILPETLGTKLPETVEEAEAL